jgi:hypothetical protein
MLISQYIDNLNDKSPKNIRSELYKLGINANYEMDGNRMVFYNDNNNRYKNISKLQLECNGLVFNTSTMKPLVIPPLTYKSNLNIPIVNMYINQDLYDIYHLNDGTNINLYYYTNHESKAETNMETNTESNTESKAETNMDTNVDNNTENKSETNPENKAETNMDTNTESKVDGRWVISTNKSFDITHKKWGPLTYNEIMIDILKDNHDIFYNLLDKTKCYTFGIKHSSIHPFNDGLNKIWFVCSTNINSGNVDHTFENNINIKPQRKLKKSIKLVNELFPLLKHAYDNYLNNEQVSYGFLLVSKNTDITNEYSNILLESTLLQKIRTVFYHNKFKNLIKVNNYDRIDYIIIYNYLDYNNYNSFIRLFPQFITHFIQLNNIMEFLIKNIINYDDLPKNHEHFNHIEILYKSLKSKFTFTSNDYEIIKSFVLSSSFINIYYDLFRSSNIM